ncbi:hypothetical protein AUK40_01840 [Candidatus Wirthbacteria bacterium CG2_30_54_11]|uniref:starch synthase n=1 Tax=Candidatus Wirthbacteria bacterium CG2_30_54_11 TaxID=1817892 RepID=A0A1J5J3Z1_9BACT|nr:MAG: hypothetical protein AUK40_01840 [Candidatus Wirthbacteria bacterium CG2_30_54_11]
MFGWEFPPVKSGGLGTACYGLTRGLTHHDVDITFVLPHIFDEHHRDQFMHLEGIFDRKEVTVKVKHIRTVLRPYQSAVSYEEEYLRVVRKREAGTGSEAIYGTNLFEEVERYALLAPSIAEEGEYDVVHCHDWMTYQAGVAVKKSKGLPLVVHVHATEFDRTGGHPNQHVYDIERAGMHAADVILAVSGFTKWKIVEHYGISPDKVVIMHNAVEPQKASFDPDQVSFGTKDKVVLFLGRITLQKGPDYFLKSAKKVLALDPTVKFIFVGSGDMEAHMVRLAADMGMAKNVLFAGFLEGRDVDRAFQMADLYVMPSVSEPFGITPLESLINGTPCIISKQSGVSEVLQHCLKVDFWDIDELTNKILAVLRYQETLGQTLVEHGQKEVYSLTWDKVGLKVKRVYEGLVA